MTCTQCCNQGRECVCSPERIALQVVASEMVRMIELPAIKRERESIATMIDAQARTREVAYPYQHSITVAVLYALAEEIRNMP